MTFAARLRRSITHFIRPRLRRQASTLLRILLVVLLCVVLLAFVTPVRNVLLPIFLPATMIQVSSNRLLQMYWLEPQIDESSKHVDCSLIQKTLDTVDWAEMVNKMAAYPVYDDDYFSRLADHPEEFGLKPGELQHLRTRYKHFLPPIDKTQQLELRLVYRVFDTAMKLFNVTYFLMEGSMLGSYRHHGITPWDDDMDVAINGTDWFKVKQILRCIPGFDVDTSTYMMYKFFYEKSKHPIGEKFYTYPNIDIFFYTEDSKFMWSLSRIKKHRMLFKVSDIFPLVSRPFEGQMVPLPRDYVQLCKAMYDPEQCVSRDFDHFRNRPLVPFVEYEYVSCEFFKKFYPFIRRETVKKGDSEVLIEYRQIGTKIISNYTLPLV